MNRPTDLLINLLALAETNQGSGCILTAGELGRWEPGYVKACEESGLLRPASLADEIICPGCEKTCLMPVGYLEAENLLEPITYVACSEKGLIELERRQLRNWEITLENIANLLAGEFESRQQSEKLLDKKLWALGVHSLGGALYEIYFASFVDHKIAQWLTEQFDLFKVPPAIVLFPEKAPPANLRQLKCINLTHILNITIEGVHLNHKQLISLVNTDPASKRIPAYLFHKNNAGTWDFCFKGRKYPGMEDLNGYHYIQHLLQNAGEKISAIKLVALTNDTSVKHHEPNNVGQFIEEGLTINELGDAGPILDEKARQQYGEHLQELREEKKDAQERDDTKRVAEIDEEFNFIFDELKRATDRKGRDVKVASIKKRTQQSVSSGIKRAINKLVEHCPELGIHLQETIKTGNRPIYQSGNPINWHY